MMGTVPSETWRVRTSVTARGTRRVTSAMARGTKGVQRTSSGRFKCKKKKIKLNIISNFCEKLITYFGFVYEI